MVSSKVEFLSYFIYSICWQSAWYTGANWCVLSHKWTFCACHILWWWHYTVCGMSARLTHLWSMHTRVLWVPLSVPSWSRSYLHSAQNVLFREYCCAYYAILVKVIWCRYYVCGGRLCDMYVNNFKWYVHKVVPLNSYLYIHWILDFK